MTALLVSSIFRLLIAIDLLPMPFVAGAPAAWIGGHYCTVFNYKAPDVLILFHGYMADPSCYYPMGTRFANMGYAVVIPRDNTGVDALTKAVDWGTSVAANVRDWAGGRRVAVVGHSMGGAAAMAAAKFTPGLSAFVAMHPAPILSGISFAQVKGPILFTTGTADNGVFGGTTSPEAALDSFGRSLEPKALVNVLGDNHDSSANAVGMQWAAASAWLGCFVKQNQKDCAWVATQMCSDKTLAWCYQNGVTVATQWYKPSGSVHV